MKNFLCGIAALAVVTAAPVRAANIEYKPIDTQRLVVQPSKVAAGLAAKTINLVGQTAAGSIEQNGYVKTINNLLKKTVHLSQTQSGPSPLPTPTMFSSTQYKNYNSPIVPTMQAARR